MKTFVCLAVIAAIAACCGCEPAQRNAPPVPAPAARKSLPLLVTAPGGIRAISAETGTELPIPRATHAAWSQDGDRLLFATPGPEPRLVLTPWPLPTTRDGRDSLPGTVLPLPPVRTTLALDWKWSFSPDGRWLFVQRFISAHHYWPHGLDEEHRDAETQVNWVGFVDLREHKIIPMPPQGPMTYLRAGIVGWSGNRGLFQVEQYKALLAIDPANPGQSQTLIENSGSISSLSPTGSHLIFYDGTEGNVTVTLHELGRGSVRELLRDPYWDPVRRHGRDYAKAASAGGTFSPDGKWVAVRTSRHVEGTSFAWDVTVELQSIDGKQAIFRDPFTLPEENSLSITPNPVWAPAGPPRFAYWKARNGRPPTLVVVSVSGDKGVTSETDIDPQPLLRQYTLPRLLWSPDGQQLAWPDESRHVAAIDFRTGAVRQLFKLPPDAHRLKWAPAPAFQR